MRQGEIHEKHIAYDLEQEIGGKVQRQIRLTLPLGDGEFSLDGTCDGVWFADADEISEHLFEVEESGPWHDPYIVHYHTKYSEVDEFPTVAGVEIKASDASMFDEMSKNGPIEGYRVQISCYWHMIEYTLGVKLTGIWFCVGQRNNGDRSFRFITEPPYSLEWLENRCREIVYYSQVGMECANSANCDKRDFDCKWWKIHKKDEADYSEFPGAAKHKKMTFQPDLAGLALEYHRESELEEVHGKRAAGKKKALEDALDIRNLPKAATMGFRMWFGTRDWVDYAALQEDHAKLLKDYEKSTIDWEKFEKENPALVARYTKKGNRFLTVKPNEKEILQLKAMAQELEQKGEKLPEPNRATAEILSESSKQALIADLGIE